MRSECSDYRYAVKTEPARIADGLDVEWRGNEESWMTSKFFS